ncbi:MAG: hypothetical protein ACYDIB_13685, partial [Desulfobulbia bacterium]
MFPSLFDLSSEDKEVNGFILENRDSLAIQFSKKRVKLEKTLEVIAAGVRETQKQRVLPMEHIWNAAGYINTCSFDLAVAGEALILEDDYWKRRYFSRMAAINIYEASIDIPNIVGKEFRTEVARLPDGEGFLKGLGQEIKKLHTFRAAHALWLKDIRVCCAAHRDKALREQLRIVFEISPTKVLRVMAEFDALLNELGALFQQGMELMPEHVPR